MELPGVAVRVGKGFTLDARGVEVGVRDGGNIAVRVAAMGGTPAAGSGVGVRVGGGGCTPVELRAVAVAAISRGGRLMAVRVAMRGR